MKRTITILTMSLCSLMAFSQIAPELIVSKPVEVKKSTNQIAYGTEDDQGNTIVLMNNFEGGVRHMVKFDKDMKLLSNEPLKTDRKRNVIDEIRIKDGELQALVDINEKFVICKFDGEKFEIPKYKKYNFGNKTHPYTYHSPNYKYFVKAIRIGESNKSNSDKRKFIIADSNWDLVESKIVTSRASQKQMGMNKFLTQKTSRLPIILDDGTIVMELLKSKIKAEVEDKENTRTNRKKKKDIPGEDSFYFVAPKSEEASDILYLGSDDRLVNDTFYQVKNDTLYTLSFTEKFPNTDDENQKSFIQINKIPFSTKEIYSSNEYEIASGSENFYVNKVKTLSVDDSGNIKFVAQNDHYGQFYQSAVYDNMRYQGRGDVLIGQIINNKSDFYYLSRNMRNMIAQKDKGAGSRYDSGSFSFSKNTDLIVLLNTGDFLKLDDHNFEAHFLDNASQKIRYKKGFGAVLKNIKSQAYVFKLGANGLEYEAIEKNYDNNLAFEKAYLT